MWPAMHACPDLAYLVGVLRQFCNNPGPAHVELVKHVLQYISGKLDLGLKFNREANTLDDEVGYTNSNFAGSKTNQKSTRGYIFMLAGATISHSSKL